MKAGESYSGLPFEGRTPMSRSRRVILLAMYAMGRLDWAPAVRVHNIHQALAQLAEVDFISGERRERRQAIRQYLKSNKVKDAGGLYVETSTSWCTIEDLQLMAACRRAGVPVLTWIRDAHALYPAETMVEAGIPFHKRWGSSLLWWLSMQGYFRTSNALAFQSESFADLFRLPPKVRQIILPPGASHITTSPIAAGAATLLYAGNGRPPRYGIDILLEAAEIARRDIAELRVTLICPPADAPRPIYLQSRPWVTLKHLQVFEIPGEMPEVRAVVIPFRAVAYHHLLLPVKLMDYLTYARPMLVTRCREIARFVEENQVGLVVDDNPESMADGIRHLFTADLDELNRMGQNALRAVHEKHSWHHRAQQILDTFEEIRQRDS
jgi:glycosyltransferase involved in cell wall biosynthesis